MSGITNPDNGMMENQQAQDLGHPIDEAKVKGASVESPIPRLREGVDTDGMIESAHEMPDEATEEARHRALRNAEKQPRPRR